MKYFEKLILSFLMMLPLSGVYSGSIFSLGQTSLGEINYPFTVSAIGRGGVEMAIQDSMILNNSNFALWSQIPRTIVTLNLLKYQTLNTSGPGGNVNTIDANFNGGYLAFPLLKNKFAMGLGLRPLSINETKIQIVPEGESSGAKEIFSTTGNISETSLIAAYALTPKFSLAGAIKYKFGKLEDKLSLNYSQDGFENIEIVTDYRFYGTGFSLHGFYLFNEKTSVGLKINLPSKHTLSTKQMSLNTNNGVKGFRDVIYPMELSGGVGYKINQRWLSGLDVNYQNWKKGYKIEDKIIPGFTDSYRIGVGVEKTPLSRKFIPFSDKLSYRGGLFFGKYNRLSHGKPVYEYGAAIGFGMPIMKIQNRMDLALEYGIRGSKTSNVESEQYFRFHISISASELWFVREEE